jgi:glycosyltransferase involved in cell wall biosynthesis
VLSSSNQLYSGIGRNLFHLAARSSDRIDFEFAIDDYVEKNVDILRDFCDREGFHLHVGKGQTSADSLDVLNEDMPALLAQDRWDVIECVCWANARTNAALLDSAVNALVCYTPHNQPIWSVPMTPTQAAYTAHVHDRALRRADLVCCVSPFEREALEQQTGRSGKCVFLPNGCDFSAFRPGPFERKPELLFVGDAAEPRKRIDRVLALFSRLRKRRPQLRLVFIGNQSEQVRQRIPPELRAACELRGYVSEAELRQAYTESLALLLLSDVEAFGIPILEALASGTPVFLSRLNETVSLFRSYRGAHFCPANDLEGSAAIIERALARGADAIREVIEDRESLHAVFEWDVIAAQKWNALAAAWYLKYKNRLVF